MFGRVIQTCTERVPPDPGRADDFCAGGSHVFAKVRSACVAVITALLGPSQIQMVAQHVEARGPRRDFELSFDPLTIIAADILSGVASCFCAPSWSLRQCTVKSSIHLNASQGRIFWPHLRA